MPLFDRRCTNPACGVEMIDCWEPVVGPVVKCDKCGYITERVWLGKGSNVIGDECDIEIRNALCNLDGTPKRYTSKAEMARVAKARGYTLYDALPDAKPNKHRVSFSYKH